MAYRKKVCNLCKSNMLVVDKKLISWKKPGRTLEESPVDSVYSESCANCGNLLFGSVTPVRKAI